MPWDWLQQEGTALTAVPIHFRGIFCCSADQLATFFPGKEKQHGIQWHCHPEQKVSGWKDADSKSLCFGLTIREEASCVQKRKNRAPGKI